MLKTFYLDRKEKIETAKAQSFYSLLSFFEGLVIAFITLFLNECIEVFSYFSLLSSLALCLPPLFSSIFIFLISFLVSHQKENYHYIRIFLLLILGVMVILGTSLFYLPNKEDINPSNPLFYYGIFIFFVLFSSLIIGLFFSIISLNNSSNADINYVENTRFGHVCLYGALYMALSSPLGGYIAEALYLSYEGYLFLFLVTSPFLLVLFFYTYRFKSYPSNLFHSDEDEHVPLKDLFSNKDYLFYLGLTALWIPLLWAGESLSSSLWVNFASNAPLVPFDSLSYGIYVGVGTLLEFLTIFINTHFGIGKKVRFSMTLAFILITVMMVSLGLIDYFYIANASIGVLISLIAIHSLKGVASGLFVTSNLAILNHILGPKKRRKGVFIAPCLYQFVNAILQLIYPYLRNVPYMSFFSFAVIALIGFILSLFLDVHLVHEGKR